MEDAELVETLAATPVWLAEGFKGMRADDAVHRPVGEEWSVAEIVAHLRASDAIIRPRIIQLLVRPGSPLPTFDERAWAVVAARASLPIAVQLQAFSAVRAETIGVLRALSPTEWDIEGMHEERGSVTLRAVVNHLSTHEAGHREQFEEAIALARASRGEG